MEGGKDPRALYEQARRDHDRAVVAAGLSLLALMVAVGGIWIAQARADPTTATVVRVLDSDDRLKACGSLQELSRTAAVVGRCRTRTAPSCSGVTIWSGLQAGRVERHGVDGAADIPKLPSR